MRQGDLSSDLAPAVGFRFERLIRTEEGKLNKHVKGFIQNILGNLDANVYIITTNDERKAVAFCWKWGVTYTRLIKADSPLEIPVIANENDLITYYDVDNDIVQNVNSRAKEGVKAELWTSREVL